ncbi:hypothetical protein P152DRAFT_512496 [Eremomyces bilateralis CBS 781.70]|uniref:Nucleolar 27S pre-rRNA processing Urb2/Npa2 C-terminal domain-containing protein n=1 Tax=Eremomyces bilateralis CBS 781.70 TaxID=1392243 RepID=A0A6G1GBE6_9PEZI|nr:uncharacterized protein P152DRAFT_512496 [Eremomyces bilateralis CBS 781.70]KAF1815230.1 hypothetical protein P152DRAFT_512496 [Eremomyces bilateralis CBS 781.70]
MAAVKESQREPSLPKLLSLDSTYDTFEDRLNAASVIAGVASKGPNSKSTSHAIQVARAEWVLRWLLERLGSDGSQSAEARAKPESFNLVAQLIHGLPIAVSARVLKSRKILFIVEKTLEEANAAGGRVVQYSNTSGGAETVSDTTESKHSKGVAVGKKRKNAESPGRPSKRARNTGLPDPSQLHQALTSLLQTIIGAAEAERANIPVSAEYLSSVFQTDVVHAAQLLGLWLSLTAQILRASDVKVSLGPVLRIWKSRVIASGKGDQTELEFSSRCLVPASALLSCAKAMQAVRSDSPSRTNLSNIEHQMEGLLIKHVVFPTFRAFEADPGRVDGKSAERREAPYLRSLLGPLKDYLGSVSSNRESLGSDGQAYELATSIFYIAIRATPLITPQQRLKHAPWLRAVFSELADCCGANLYQSPSPKSTTVSAEALEQLLRAAKQESLTLLPEDLMSAAASFSNLLDDSKEVRWSLVAAVLQINPAFLFHAANIPSLADGLPQTLRMSIFKRLASLELDDESINSRIDIPSPGSASVNFVDEIVIPLVSAYVSARQPAEFISEWFQQLHESWPSKSGGIDGQNTWQLKAMGNAVGLTVVGSLTMGEVVSLLETYVATLRQDFKDWQSDVSQGGRAFAGLVVLHGLLRGVQSDDVADALKSQFDEIHLMLLRIKSDISEQTVGLLRPAFRLLSCVQDIAVSSLDASESRQRLEPFWNSSLLKCIQSGLKPTNFEARYRLVESCLPEIVCLLAQFSSASDAIPEFEDCSVKAIDSAATAICKVFDKHSLDNTTGEDRKTKATQAPLSTLLLYPEGFSIIPSNTRTTLFKKLIHAASAAEVHQDHDAPHGNIASFQPTLSSLAKYLCEAGPSTARDELLGEVLRDLERKTKHKGGRGHSVSNVPISTYLHLFPRTIPRRHREAVIDCLVNKLQDKKMDNRSIGRILGVLVRLMAVPNPTSKLLTDLRAWDSIMAGLKTRGLLEDPLISSLVNELFQLATAQSSYLKEKVQDSFVASLSKAYHAHGQPKRQSQNIDSSTVTSAAYLCEMLSQGDVRAQHDTLQSARKQLAELDVATLSGLASQLSAISKKARFASEAIQVLDIVAESITERKSEDDVLKRLLLDACIQLGNTDDVRMFGRLSSFIVVSLKDRPAMMSQWSSECLLSSLANVATGRSTFSPEDSSTIFRRLCALGLALVAFHRQRQRGRLHLLLPFLQSLLSWLFIVDHRTGPFLDRPSWVPNGPLHLTPADAAAYSRLLTTFCSPTVSSVQRHHRKTRDDHEAHLVDETKRAKDYAGQYVHHIVMQFCRDALDARLGPAVRDALIPGIFAAIDIVPASTLKAMNDEMDSTGRAIWHSLYDEWRRVSGGRGKLDRND